VRTLAAIAVALTCAASIGGCVAIDRTPLSAQPFYRDARARVARAGAATPAAAAPLFAGAARTEITPPIGTPLAAFGARRATGVADPVYARALALSAGDASAILISVELLAVTDDLTHAVVGRIRRAVPVPAEAILLAATHTHSGPGAIGRLFWEQLAAGTFDPRRFAQVADRIAAAAVEAWQRRAPAAYVRGQADAGDLVQNRIFADGPTDPTLRFIAVRGAAGTPIAYVLNFAAHPTVLRSKNSLVSGDFPGYAMRALEADGAVALYFSGALGDQKPRPPAGRGVFARASAMGAEIATRVRTAIPTDGWRDHARLAARRVAVPLPPPQVRVGVARRLPAAVGRLLLDRETLLQAIRIDDIALLGLPCDLSATVGRGIAGRAEAAGVTAWIVGFANDYIGYVIPSEIYDLPVYEGRMSFNGPHMADYLRTLSASLIGISDEPRMADPGTER
jgi:hypothetical protein